MHGDAGNDTIGAYGFGSVGMWSADSNDTFEIFNHGIEYAHGGAGADTYDIFDNMLSADGGFVKVYEFEFEVGEDAVRSQIYDKTNIETKILDWGANTGTTFHDTMTGNTGTVMLVGVASNTLVAGHDLLLA